MTQPHQWKVYCHSHRSSRDPKLELGLKLNVQLVGNSKDWTGWRGKTVVRDCSDLRILFSSYRPTFVGLPQGVGGKGLFIILLRASVLLLLNFLDLICLMAHRFVSHVAFINLTSAVTSTVVS